MSKNLRPFLKFTEYQTEFPLSKELPYWESMEDLMVLSDGTLALGYHLHGLSIETWDSDAMNRMTTGFRSLLNSLPDGCEVSFVSETDSNYHELISKHEELGKNNPKISWLTNERAETLRSDVREFRLLKINLYVFVYQRLNSDTQSRPSSFFKSFFSTPKKFHQIKKKEHETAERDLRQIASQLIDGLESGGLIAKSLSGADSWKLIFRFLNPKQSLTMDAPRLDLEYQSQEFSPEELAKAPELSFSSPREQLCHADLIQGYDSFFLDGYFHRLITLKTLPEFTHSALIEKLSQLPFPNYLHVHIRVPEQSKELSSLQAKRRMAHSMSVTHSGKASDLESEARLQSTEELLRELINTGQKIFYFQTVVLIRAENRDDLDIRTKTVLSVVRELNGAEALAETVAGFKLWKTLFPLGTLTSVRTKRVKTDNLADFIPLYEPYTGSAEEKANPVCLFRNRASGLVAYDPFNSKLPNYNNLVTGSSGAGKSFINNLVLLQYISQNPLIYIIDIGGSYRKLCGFLGGQYIEITPPRVGETCKPINPFELPLGQIEPSPQKIKFVLALLENILTDQEGDRLPKLDKSLLEETVLNLYKQTRGKSPKFSDLNNSLLNSKDDRLRQFSKMLYPWTEDRPYGRLLDGENALSLSSNFVVFDLKGLSSYPDLQAVMILIITDFILGRIESDDKSTQGRRKQILRKQILMDECWQLLKSQASSQFMEYCVRTLRKTGSGITFITQGLEEIVASPIGSAILSNTATKFILMQRGDLEPIRKILKLNEQEMALISSLKQSKGKYSEAFLMANDARTVIRACPIPIEYWLATSDASDNALLESTRKEFPNWDIQQAICWLARHFPVGSQGTLSIPKHLIMEKKAYEKENI